MTGLGSDQPNAESAAKGGGEAPSNSPPPPSQPPQFQAPEITAESLPRIIDGIDKMVMTGIIATKRLPLPREVLEKMIPMTETDKQTLAFFAPYAMEYAPLILQYAKPVLAGCFVGFWGMSIVGRTKAITAASKEYLEWLKSQEARNGNAS